MNSKLKNTNLVGQINLRNLNAKDFISLIRASAKPNGNPPIYGYFTTPYDSVLADGMGLPWINDPQSDLYAGQMVTSENIHFLEIVAELNKTGALLIWLPKLNPAAPGYGYDYGYYQYLVEQGQVLLWLADQNDIHTLRRGEVEIGLMPLPEADSGHWGNQYASFAHFIARDSPNVQACWNWLVYLSTSPEAFFGVPERRSIANSDEWEAFMGTEQAQVLRQAVERGRNVSTRYAAPTLERISHYVYFRWWVEAYVKVIDQHIDPAKALAKAQDKVDKFQVCLAETDMTGLLSAELQGVVDACVTEADPIP